MRSRWRVFHSVAPALVLGLVLAFGGCGHSATTTTSSSGNPPPFCGDKVVQPELGEECDDGSKDDSGPCLSTCKKARCGDGKLWTGMEECDDANSSETDTCISNCNMARCGDGYVEKGVELCDDGNEEDNDACSALCKPGVGCGNGQIDVGEECDDGNTSNFDACVQGCKKAKCGDGYGQAGVEECDDGNTVDTDACSNACKVNPIAQPGCPGTAVALTMGAPVTLGIKGGEGVTVDQGSCGGAGPEVVYAFTPAEDGLMKLKLLPLEDAYDAVLYVRKSCSDSASEVVCEDRAGNGGLEAAEVPVTGGQTYYVFADARDAANAGRFFLTAELTSDVQGDNCPGVPVPLALNQTATFTGNTLAAHADRVGQGLCAQANTPEIVYEIAPQADGHIFAQLMPTYVAAFYVRSSCGDTRSQLLCSYSGVSGDPLTIDIPAAANHRYYFFVDGALGHAGGYSVAFTLAKS